MKDELPTIQSQVAVAAGVSGEPGIDSALPTAVLMLVFNRPDTTRVVLDAVRKARPARLYVACDGPRQGHATDDENVKEVRNLFQSVDWPCDVSTLYREENLGCKVAVSSGITWFFEHEERGIIVEDDVVPRKEFFDFCQEGLEIWADDKHIGGIGGFVPLVSGSPFLSMHGSVWGWATWRSRWLEHYCDTRCLSQAELLKLASNMSLFSVAEKLKISRTLQAAEANTWDYYWMFGRIRASLFMVMPGAPLTRNIGFGSQQGTHTHGAVPAGFRELASVDLIDAHVDMAHVSSDNAVVIRYDYRRFWSRHKLNALKTLLSAFLIDPVLMFKATLLQGQALTVGRHSVASGVNK